ncbi:MAG: DUF4160 domain-containing protein [Thermoguttaceae bacterium]
MPKALRDFLGLSFFFWSNEESGSGLEPIHIHITKGVPHENATKVWLKQDGSVELCHNNSQLTPKELSKSLEYIRANYSNIVSEWYRHFGM